MQCACLEEFTLKCPSFVKGGVVEIPRLVPLDSVTVLELQEVPPIIVLDGRLVKNIADDMKNLEVLRLPMVIQVETALESIKSLKKLKILEYSG